MTNEPQRTSAGRLVIHKLIKGSEIVSVVNVLSSPVAVYKLSPFYSSIMP